MSRQESPTEFLYRMMQWAQWGMPTISREDARDLVSLCLRHTSEWMDDKFRCDCHRVDNARRDGYASERLVNDWKSDTCTVGTDIITARSNVIANDQALIPLVITDFKIFQDTEAVELQPHSRSGMRVNDVGKWEWFEEQQIRATDWTLKR